MTLAIPPVWETLYWGDLSRTVLKVPVNPWSSWDIFGEGETWRAKTGAPSPPGRAGYGRGELQARALGVRHSRSYLHKELAAAVAQQLVQPYLDIEGGPLPADIQVLPRQADTTHADQHPATATQPANGPRAWPRTHRDTQV